jgi:BON domain-containing protein
MKFRWNKAMLAVGIGAVLFANTTAAQAQSMGGGSSSGSSGGSSGSSGGSSGGTFGSGGGSTGGSGGSGNSFLGTGVGGGSTNGTSFLSGYGPGSIGQAALAGNSSTLNNGSPFSRFYVNIYGLGVPAGTTNTTTTAYGQPLYSSLYPGTTVVATVSSGSSLGTNRLSSAGFTATPVTGTGVGGARRPANYTTGLGFRPRPISPEEMQANLRQVLARSADLDPSGAIQIGVEDQTVVLRGTVPDADQRRLAENLVRLSPGVRAVRNELAVVQPSASPKP